MTEALERNAVDDHAQLVFVGIPATHFVAIDLGGVNRAPGQISQFVSELGLQEQAGDRDVLGEAMRLAEAGAELAAENWSAQPAAVTITKTAPTALHAAIVFLT